MGATLFSVEAFALRMQALIADDRFMQTHTIC